LNTDAVFLATSDDEPDVLKKETKGDASESAIIKFVEPVRPIKEYRAACKRHCAIPFNSSNKWMLAIHEQEGPNADSLPLFLMVKGAPERVMAMCTKIFLNGKEVAETIRHQLTEALEWWRWRGAGDGGDLAATHDTRLVLCPHQANPPAVGHRRWCTHPRLHSSLWSPFEEDRLHL
jgi:hypothetical protein